MILFPYATGDFHSGTGEFHYTDKDGKEKILYHNGYVNYTAAMKQIMEKAGIQDADTVLVTGYSAGWRRLSGFLFSPGTNLLLNGCWMRSMVT